MRHVTDYSLPGDAGTQSSANASSLRSEDRLNCPSSFKFPVTKPQLCMSSILNCENQAHCYDNKDRMLQLVTKTKNGPSHSFAIRRPSRQPTWFSNSICAKSNQSPSFVEDERWLRSVVCERTQIHCNHSNDFISSHHSCLERNLNKKNIRKRKASFVIYEDHPHRDTLKTNRKPMYSRAKTAIHQFEDVEATSNNLGDDVSDDMTQLPIARSSAGGNTRPVKSNETSCGHIRWDKNGEACPSIERASITVSDDDVYSSAVHSTPLENNDAIPVRFSNKADNNYRLNKKIFDDGRRYCIDVRQEKDVHGSNNNNNMNMDIETDSSGSSTSCSSESNISSNATTRETMESSRVEGPLPRMRADQDFPKENVSSTGMVTGQGGDAWLELENTLQDTFEPENMADSNSSA